MQELRPLPLIVGFVAELMFQTRIESVAENLGFRVMWIEREVQVGPPDPDVDWRQLGEHLDGPSGALLDLLSVEHPALLLFDLANSGIPWRRWLALIKSVSATRRIPVVCFGSHVDTEAMGAAKRAGAEAVLARSRFTQDMANILQKYARLPDAAAIQAACAQALSPVGIQGLELFNQGEYFEAHEVLEAAWNQDESEGRELYRAILQVAVAYLQIERGNYNGAMKMFLRVRQWIDPLPEVCRGVEVGRLREDARQAHQALSALGRERVKEFDHRLFKPVVYRVGK